MEKTQAGFKYLKTYQRSAVSYDLTVSFCNRFVDKRSRTYDQMIQAGRSGKQNIVEGSSERSLSSKLKLYDVSKSSGMELVEDLEDILGLEGLFRWDKNDPRFVLLRKTFEGFPSRSSNPSNPPRPSVSAVLAALGVRRIRGKKMDKKEVEIVANYLIDILVRNGYLLDRQINAVEEKHKREGGYREKLLKRRLEFRRGRSDPT